MASQAFEAINAAPRDPNVERLLDLLFRGGPEYRNDPTDTDRIEQIKAVYEGVAKFAHKTVDLGQPGEDEAAADQVNIFCNLDRVQPHSNGRQYVDTSTGTILDNLDEDEFTACNTRKANLAFTWAPSQRQEADETTTYLPSQITLCPWFYQWALAKDRNDWSEVGKKARLAKEMIPAVTKGWPFTPIDAVQLLDKVLLHEFTHTVACGEMTDVYMKKGGAPGFKLAYGWRATTTLAKQQNIRLSNGQFPQADERPVKNSDSYALFASGVKLLNEPQPAIFIQDNGKLTTTRPQKRALPIELQYKRTPLAFEGFVTSIRAAALAVESA